MAPKHRKAQPATAVAGSDESSVSSGREIVEEGFPIVEREDAELAIEGQPLRLEGRPDLDEPVFRLEPLSLWCEEAGDATDDHRRAPSALIVDRCGDLLEPLIEQPDGQLVAALLPS